MIVPEPGRPRRDEGRLRRSACCQQAGLNIGYLAFNAQKPPFDKKEVRQALQHGDRQGGDHQGRLPGRRPGGEEPDPADDLVATTTRSRTIPTIRRRPRRCSPEAGVKTTSRSTSGAMPVQRPYNPNAKRIAELMQADLAKVGVNAKLVTYEWGEYRKRLQQGEHQHGPARLDRRQRRSGQLPLPARLRRGARRRPEPRQVVQQGVRRPAREGASTTADVGRAHQALRADAGDRAGGGAVVCRSPTRSSTSRCARRSTGYKVSPLGRHDFDGVDMQVGRIETRPAAVDRVAALRPLRRDSAR